MSIAFSPERRGFLGLSAAENLMASHRRKDSQPQSSRSPKVGNPNKLPEPPHHWWDRVITRRGALTTAAVIGGAGILAAVVRPWEKWFPSDERLKDEWYKLSSGERIRRLEFKNYAKFKDFDPTQELITATSQYYCQSVNCDPSKLNQAVQLVDRKRIIEEIKKDNAEINISEDELGAYADNTLEMVGQKSGQVLIQTARFDEEVKRTTSSQPNLVREMQGRDLYTVQLKSTLFHAYSHVFQTKEEFDVNINLNTGRPVVVNKFRGFDFYATNPDGTTTFITGGGEAATEYVGTLVGQESGPIIAGSAYSGGLRLLEAVNTRAGVHPFEFRDYYTGKKSVKELFRRWGALKNRAMPDENTGLLILLVIAVHVKDPVNFPRNLAMAKIDELLRP